MPNIRLLQTNHVTVPATILVASSEVSALPVALIRNTDRSYAWRSSTATGIQTIDIDVRSVQAVTAVALANVKRLENQVVELYHRGDADAAGAAVLVATLAAQDRDTRAVAAFFASQSHRHWQLKWTNPAAVLDYAELGFAFLGTYVEPAVNVRVPMPMSRPDPALGSSSVDGQESFALRTKYLVGVCVFDAVLEAQLSQLRTLFDTIGVSTPLFLVLDTALSWTTWFARIMDGLQWEIEPEGALGRYRVQLPWKEVR